MDFMPGLESRRMARPVQSDETHLPAGSGISFWPAKLTGEAAQLC